jgi:tetratricopeptide (TPR) repeat protein
VRARQIAAGCTVLAAVALVAAVFAYFSGQRARRAEHEAQQTRALAEQARGQAEQLLGYLSDDFGRELESFGRLEVLAEFSQRQIAYFHGLPPVLRGPESTRNGALALIHHSRALRTLGQLDVAGANADEAVRLLSGLRDSGDHSAATTISLALAYAAQGRVLESRSDPASLPTSQRALALLQPLLSTSSASLAAKRAYVEIAARVGFQQGVFNRPEEVIRTERDAMQMAADLGARDLSDLDMGAYYAEAGGWMATSLEGLGRFEEARRTSEECLTVADQVLERRPGYRLALHAAQILAGVLTSVARDELNPAAALPPALRQEQVSLTLLKLDPNNVTSLNNMSVAEGQLQSALWSAGRLQESATHNLKQFDYARRASGGGPSFVVNASGTMAAVAYFQAALGDAAGATSTVVTAAAMVAKLRQSEPAGSTTVVIADGWVKIAEALTAFQREDLTATRRSTAEAVRELDPLAQHGDLQFNRNLELYFAQHLQGRAEFLAGDFAAAERSEAKAIAARKAAGAAAMDDRRFLYEAVTWLALAQTRQGHAREAAQTIAPAVNFQRELAARNRGDRWQPQELAAALYAQALCDPGKRVALLHEATALIDGLAPEVRATHDVQRWRARILEAQRSGTANGG